MNVPGLGQCAARRLFSPAWNHPAAGLMLKVCVCALAIGRLADASAPAMAAPPLDLLTAYTPGFTVHDWTTKQGLPDNTVTALRQSRDGYLWVGTPDGLARFDGVQFRYYGMADGLPDVSVTTILEDRAGTLWVGTEKGLARSTGQSPAQPAFKTELSGNISGLAEDAQGRLWIGTYGGLYVWADGQLKRPEGSSHWVHPETDVLYSDRDGNIWVWEADKQLFKITDGQAAEVSVDFPLPKARYVHQFLEDRTGRLWVSPGNGFMLCRENGQWKTFGPGEGVPYQYISSLAETTDGTLWAGSYGAGLLRLDKNQFAAANENRELPNQWIHTLCPDAEGNLWVGTASSGLVCLRPKRLTTLAAATGLSNEVVRSITELPDGALAAATEDGIFRQQGKYFARQNYSKADIYPWTRSVLATRDGNLWWGTDVYLFDLQSSLKLGYPTTNLPAVHGNSTVLCLFEDRQTNLWVGMSAGLWREQAGKLLPVSGVPPASPVEAIAEAPDGSLCAGTASSGIFLLQPGGTLRYTTQQGLGNDTVRALYYDHTGVLWIGTRGGGLSRLRDGHLFTYTTRDGLPSDTISQIQEDDDGAIWLGSNRGISRVSRRELDALAVGKIDELHPLNLGEDDGMLSEECSGGTGPNSLKSHSGRLYFCTLRGIVAVDPKRYAGHDTPPAVVIEDMLVNGRAFAVPENGEAGETVLHPGRNDLEFHYTALHSPAPESVIFRYQLAGLNEQPVNAATRRFAIYAQIPPGHYRFQVWAANQGGDWSPAGATVRLWLQPYFYQTWWFQAGTLGAGALALALLVRYIVKRRLQHRLHLLELEQGLENERRRIARDLHDEMGARLTGIAHLGELAARNSQSSEEMKTQVKSITSRIQQLMGAMNEVVWTINPKNDTLPNIANFLGDYAERFLVPTGITWRLESDPEFPDLPVSAQCRHNLLMAAKETLNNAVRHASATIIQMHIHVEDGQLAVIITDNGCGFETGKARPGGNGLVNIISRMELIKGRVEIQSQPGKGTTVRLAMPLPRQNF